MPSDSYDDKNSSEDEVGYGKPPRKHQFKKGQSGNRKGRSRESRNMSTLLKAGLKRRVSIVVGNKTVKTTIGELIARSAAEAAVSGSLSHIQILLRLEDSETENEPQCVLLLEPGDEDI
jgi:hypothetical protein